MQQLNSALIVVDVQNGFCPGGNLAVADADQIIPCINALGRVFQNIVINLIRNHEKRHHHQ